MKEISNFNQVLIHIHQRTNEGGKMFLLMSNYIDPYVAQRSIELISAKFKGDKPTLMSVNHLVVNELRNWGNVPKVLLDF